MEFPTGQRYDIVLADPPWSYFGPTDKWGAAAKFYQCMTDHEINSLPVRSILNTDGIIFLWTTSSKLQSALNALLAWGCYYRGVAFVWIKTKKDGEPIGAQGVRPSITKPLTEFVLAGSPVMTGRPLDLEDEGVQQTIFAPKREHSHKPDEVQERIERMYPNATKIELFARRTRLNWVTWGDEVSEG